MTKTLTLDLAMELNDAASENPTVFTKVDGSLFERGTETVSASSIGQCARRLVYERDNHPKDPGIAEPFGVFDRGHAVEYQTEKRLRQALQKHGLELHLAGEAQCTLVWKNLSATPDGVIVNRTGNQFIINATETPVVLHPRECAVIEFKSVDPRSAMSLKNEHVRQVRVQIELINKCTQCAPTQGIILYTDAADHSRRTLYSVDQGTDGFLKEQQIRAQDILDCEDPGDMRAEGRWTGACQYCSYTAVCGEAMIRQYPNQEESTQLSLPEKVELNALLKDRKYARHAVDEMTEEVKFLDDEIKEWMKAHDTNRCQTDEYRVSWSVIKPQRRLKNKEALSLYPELQDEDSCWSDTPEQTRLTITALHK